MLKPMKHFQTKIIYKPKIEKIYRFFFFNLLRLALEEIIEKNKIASYLIHKKEPSRYFK